MANGRAARMTETIDGATEAMHRVSDVASDYYFRAIEYTRANPQTGALIALGVGVTLGCLLARGSRRGGGGLLTSLAMAAGGAAIDAFRGEVD